MNCWVIGSLVVAALSMLFPLWIRHATRRMARNTLAMSRRMYGTMHEFRRVNGRDFAGLDQAFYDNTQAWLVEQGFVFLGDLEDVTVNHPPAGTPPIMLAPGFIRTLAGDDGTIVAAIYHARVPAIEKVNGRPQKVERSVRMLELCSYFSDGTSTTTMPWSTAALSDVAPEQRRNVLPADATREQLLATHRATVAQLLATWKSAEIVPVRSFDEMLALQNREQEQRIAFRRSVGWVTERELVRLAGEGKEALAKSLHQEIQRLVRDQKAAPPAA